MYYSFNTGVREINLNHLKNIFKIGIGEIQNTFSQVKTIYHLFKIQ